jgi:hypothetical protein
MGAHTSRSPQPEPGAAQHSAAQRGLSVSCLPGPPLNAPVPRLDEFPVPVDAGSQRPAPLLYDHPSVSMAAQEGLPIGLEPQHAQHAQGLAFSVLGAESHSIMLAGQAAKSESPPPGACHLAHNLVRHE